MNFLDEIMSQYQEVGYTWESDLRWQGQNQTFRLIFFRRDTFQETYVGQNSVLKVAPAAVRISSGLEAVDTDIQAGGGQRVDSSDARSRWHRVAAGQVLFGQCPSEQNPEQGC